MWTPSAALKFTYLSGYGSGLVKWITEQEIFFSVMTSVSSRLEGQHGKCTPVQQDKNFKNTNNAN